MDFMPSPVREFEVQNYKSLKSTGRIKTAGISLILGPNSSGKTSVLESLLVLKQTFENNQMDLQLNGNIIKAGDFANIIHMQNTNNDLSYRFYFGRELDDQDPELICPVCGKEYTYEGYLTNHFEDKHPKFWERYDASLEKYNKYHTKNPFIEFVYSYDEPEARTRLRTLTFGNPSPKSGLHATSIKFTNTGSATQVVAKDGEQIIFKQRYNRSESETRFTQNPNYLIRGISKIFHTFASTDTGDGFYYFRNIPEKGKNIDFLDISKEVEKVQDYYMHKDEVEKIDEDVPDLVVGLNSRLYSMCIDYLEHINSTQSFLNDINHIGPLRNSPRRIYFGAGGSPGLQAEGRSQVEERIFKAERTQNKRLIENTNEWLSETGFDCRLDVTRVGVGDLYQLEVIQDDLEVNLADAGFGLSQTLPIIVECVGMQMEGDDSDSTPAPPRFTRTSSTTLPLGLIEQPEIHLNPRIEASLADFFIEVMQSGVNLMIETHSEHLLNRLQRRIADGSVENPDNVVIYFISKSEGISEIEEIDILSSGTLSDWPDGFFQDDFEDTIEILKESVGE